MSVPHSHHVERAHVGHMFACRHLLGPAHMTDDMHNYDCIPKTCATKIPRQPPPQTAPLANEDGPISVEVLIREGSAGATRARQSLIECEGNGAAYRFAAVILRARLAQLPSARL